MKVSLFIPYKYSIHDTLFSEISNLGINTLSFESPLLSSRMSIMRRLANRTGVLRSYYRNYSLSAQNKAAIDHVERYDPNVVIIYNNESLLPATLAIIKSRGARIVVILGDYPFFSLTNDYNLTILEYADLIACPDSYWTKELSKYFPGRVRSMVMGNANPSFKRLDNMSITNDLVYVGYCHTYSWGYAKLKFLNEFALYDIRILGNGFGWEKWMKFFPNIMEKISIGNRVSDDALNRILNSAKVYPIDRNPGIINGIHLRFFDCLAAGICPLMERTEDLLMISREVEVPSFGDYAEIHSVLPELIRNDDHRERIVKDINSVIESRFGSDKYVKELLEGVC